MVGGCQGKCWLQREVVCVQCLPTMAMLVQDVHGIKATARHGCCCSLHDVLCISKLMSTDVCSLGGPLGKPTAAAAAASPSATAPSATAAATPSATQADHPPGFNTQFPALGKPSSSNTNLAAAASAQPLVPPNQDAPPGYSSGWSSNKPQHSAPSAPSKPQQAPSSAQPPQDHDRPPGFSGPAAGLKGQAAPSGMASLYSFLVACGAVAMIAFETIAFRPELRAFSGSVSIGCCTCPISYRHRICSPKFLSSIYPPS